MNRNSLMLVLGSLSVISLTSLLFVSYTIKIRDLTQIDDMLIETEYIQHSEAKTSTKGAVHIGKRLAAASLKPKVQPKAKIENKNKTNRSGSFKYLIYQCDRSRLCGGWGDRQRSVVSTYMLAQITNRTFGLNVTSPCDIRELYVPNKVNWVIDPAQLKGLSTETVIGMDNNFSPKNFHRLHTSDVIYLRTNRDLFYLIRQNKEYSKMMPKWAKGKGRAQAFRNGWGILMKHQGHLQNRIETFLRKIPKGDLICAHIRIGRTKRSKDSLVFNKMSDVYMIWEFLDRYVNNASKIFIASDSEEVRRMARARYKVKEVDTGGTVVHVDRERNARTACEGLELAILDQTVLGTCKVLLMSQSNFGQRAAMLGGLYDNLFMWHKGTITKYVLS
ncbi:uncharacterized protein LOC121372855 isoform X2 [Gigantopelta aegis]|nr:uncharacterized protein LOC121372855 isoform X2 [Gigantopelta aegis]